MVTHVQRQSAASNDLAPDVMAPGSVDRMHLGCLQVVFYATANCFHVSLGRGGVDSMPVIG